jgi:CheY-like chemotaxis protein
MSATVLIADDDPDMLDLLSTLLAEEGFQTVAVSDSVTALHIIHTRRPTLAIIDLALPVMDGRELIERLRQEPGPPLPVIAMTTAPFPDLSEEPLEVDAYLTKPFDLEELLEHVTYLASQQQEMLPSHADGHLSLISVRPGHTDTPQTTNTRPS